ncbi:MAG: carboxypeptidase regulatory-like domain-containing protein [bacterium]|nr:carboxypeptidase regulatory-like domain-containing protein [bacterium]
MNDSCDDKGVSMHNAGSSMGPSRTLRLFTRGVKRAVAFAALALAVGCAQPVVEGRVVDVKGDALPGAAVTVAGTPYQALTNARGEYRVSYRPGPVQVDCVKTGYTPGRLELEVTEARVVPARDVALWPLPPDAGVFLFQNCRYTATKPIQPETFQGAGDRTVHGTRRWSEVETLDPQPTIMSFNMPRYGIRFCQLELAEIPLAIEMTGPQTIEIWRPTRTIPISAVAIDGPDGVLVQVRYDGALSPGCYAVHWGALDGDTHLETRMFFFSVGERPLAPEPKAEGEDGGEDLEGEEGEEAEEEG